MPCENCAPFEGLWVRTEAGLRRCSCEDGQRLLAADNARKSPRNEPPILPPQVAMAFVEMLAAIPFFPTEGPARSLIGEEIRCMCRSEEEALWLVQRAARLFTRGWPGPSELRRIYCSKYRPLDGVELIGPSEAFPDGVPSEKRLEAPGMKALPAGRSVSAAESLENTVADLAKAKSMNNLGPTKVRDIPILPPGQRVTQADIDEAVERRRDAVAREELGL